MRYRGVARRGTLVFGGVSFDSRPKVYEITSEEVAILQSHYGDRVALELLEPEVAVAEPEPDPEEPNTEESGRRRSRRRDQVESDPSPGDEEPEGA